MSGESLWDLPDSWTWERFGDVADVCLELEDAKRFPAAVHIAPNHIESGTARLIEQGTVAGDKVAGPKHRFTRGQVLYSKIRPYLAKAIIAPCDGFCSSDMYPIDARCSPEFLVRWLVSPAFTARVSRDQNRTVLPKVNLATLRELPVPVPPPQEQRRITAKLEALQARSRRAREALDAVPPLLEKLRQSILAAAFRGDLTADWRAKNKDVEPASKLLERIRTERRKKWEESELAKLKAKGKSPTDDKWKSKYKEPAPVDTTGLPELPQGWCWASVDDVADIAGGLTKHGSKRSDGKDVPLVSVAAVQLRRIDAAQVNSIRLLPEDGDKGDLRAGDLLIVEGNGSLTHIGRVATWNDEVPGARHQNHLIRVRPHLLKSAYVQEWLASPLGRRLIIAQATSAAGLYTLSLSKVAALPIPLAPGPEQPAMLERVLEAVSRVAALREVTETSSGQLAILDRGVLAKAFRGELVPQDPNDEPEAVVSPTDGPRGIGTTKRRLGRRSGPAEERGVE